MWVAPFPYPDEHHTTSLGVDLIKMASMESLVDNLDNIGLTWLEYNKELNMRTWQ